MTIKTIPVGPLQANCYLVVKDNKCLVIDPGDDFEKIKKEIGDLKVAAVLITHYHFDHVGALTEVKDFYNVPVYDKNNLKEQNYKIDNFDFNIIHTPGHSEDAIVIYFEHDQIMFTGDFLFHGSIGRTDLPGSNHLDMLKSLDKIKKYDGQIKIYSGHGSSSTLEFEFKYNPFLQ